MAVLYTPAVYEYIFGFRVQSQPGRNGVRDLVKRKVCSFIVAGQCSHLRLNTVVSCQWGQAVHNEWTGFAAHDTARSCRLTRRLAAPPAIIDLYAMPQLTRVDYATIRNIQCTVYSY